MRKLVLPLALVAAIGAFTIGATWTRELWLPWFEVISDGKDSGETHPAHGPNERIKLSKQARENLRLVVKPIEPQTFRRAIQLPGVVVERRGKGDQSIVAPVAGVVKMVHALPGDVIHLGEALMTLRINSEPLQMSQTELFKTAQEIKITGAQKSRLETVAKTGDVAQVRLLELQYQLDRLGAARKAYRADLALKGLLPNAIDQVENGNFIKEIVVRVPAVAEEIKSKSVNPSMKATSAEPLMEVEELKVFLGEQVQAGQLLGYLSNHQNLYIEGRGFREDTPLLEKTAAKGWPLQTTIQEEKAGSWPPLEKPLTILYLANNIDPMSQTFPFYVPLPNQYREYNHDGKKYRIWRFRPGQRVQLGVPIQDFDNVFVFPVAAIVREGAEAYVFRQNGDMFERKPVHIVFEDSANVLVANDGSILPGNYIAQNAAEALGRALKAESEKGGGGGHDHHGHSH
jgi:hypothetical protein